MIEKQPLSQESGQWHGVLAFDFACHVALALPLQSQ